MDQITNTVTLTPDYVQGYVGGYSALVPVSSLVPSVIKSIPNGNEIVVYNPVSTVLSAAGVVIVAGGGLGTLAAATDYVTAPIATANTSISTAIASITPATPVVLGAGPTAITRALHLNRSVTSAQAAATSVVFAATATSGALAGDLYEELNTGAGMVTASGALTAAFGYKLTANTGEAFTALYNAGVDAFYSTTVDPKALLAVANNWALAQSSSLSAIAYAATVTIDGLTHSNHINIGALTGPITLANPTNWTNAGTVNIHLTQDATGSRLISFGTKFRAVGGIAGITLSTAANAWDMLSFVYHPTKDLYFLAIAKGAA